MQIATPPAASPSRRNWASTPRSYAWKSFADRAAFERALGEQIDAHRVEIVVLAGFMRVLSPEFTERYAGRLINIHPALLPKYRGLHTHSRALEARDTEHGASVHFATAELDGGPVVLAVQGCRCDRTTPNRHWLHGCSRRSTSFFRG